MNTSTPAGWYPAHDMQGQLRWWDGEQWTDLTARANGPASIRSGAVPYVLSKHREGAISAEIRNGLIAFCVAAAAGLLALMTTDPVIAELAIYGFFGGVFVGLVFVVIGLMSKPTRR